MGGLIYTAEAGGLIHFVSISLVIGCLLAWQSGRAIAGTWGTFGIVPVYMLILAAAVRFLHYALVGEELLNVQYYLVSFILVIAAAAYGYRSRRAEQMVTQYSWLYRKSGPLSWTLRT